MLPNSVDDVMTNSAALGF